jgi:acetylornithine deacetylase/succinyl-diaminopimelate desuccinylase-like protein
MAPYQPPAIRPLFENTRHFLQQEGAVQLLHPYFRSLLQASCTLTTLRAGRAVNVVPSRAYAELDCRLLPSQQADKFVEELKDTLADPAIEIEILLKGVPSASREDSELFHAVRKVVSRFQSSPGVGPVFIPGFTDSRWFRSKGVPAYGFCPFRLSESEAAGVHGDNERISLENFRFGLSFFSQVLAELVREN